MPTLFKRLRAAATETRSVGLYGAPAEHMHDGSAGYAAQRMTDNWCEMGVLVHPWVYRRKEIHAGMDRQPDNYT